MLDPKLDQTFVRLCETYSTDQLQILADQVREHLKLTHAALGRNEFLDVATADQIAKVLLHLLDQYNQIPEAKRSLVVGASRYFVESKDLQSDLESVLGFDDDVAVLNYVLVEINRKDLRIDL